MNLVIFLGLLFSHSSATVKREASSNPPAPAVHGHLFSRPDSILGLHKPHGPLSDAFQDIHRFPGFPFEFPPIVPGAGKKYLIFPADSAANYLASARRCGGLGGRLVRLETPVEMEILACALQGPAFVASWMGEDFGGPLKGSCPVLYPGGVIASSLFRSFT